MDGIRGFQTISFASPGADSAVEMTRESLMDTLVQIWCWFEVVGLHHYWMRDTLLCCCQALKHTEDDEQYAPAA